MSLFSRLFTWGKSEAHNLLDQLEDPTKMAEQGIRDLREDLKDGMEGLAKVKAQAIRLRRDRKDELETAADYERKAMQLLQRSNSGALDAGEADRLAAEALSKRDAAADRAKSLEGDLADVERMTAQLEGNVRRIRSQISKWENELRTLKARAQVSSATRKLNAELAQIDGSGTISMLERMRDKVREQESLAEAYGDIASAQTSVDDEIDAALGRSDDTAKTSQSLADLKKRMGLDG